ncbi:hypothetical protein FH972_021221 [Carpinus fangiana]|uniref:Thioesterase domain-containing protein n=1 Tax=Carpinus fangiana TaxID=176857 RepID=A0A5N6KNW7_9ROSI|nr:hypothetical protein FH972_021221 [Carpinus fangiana]
MGMLRSSTRLRPILRPQPRLALSGTLKRGYVYPKEGVFQQNSPPWTPSTVEAPPGYGYGRQPFPGTVPQQTHQPRPSNHPPHQQPPPPPDPESRFSPGLRTFARWTFRLAKVVLCITVFNAGLSSMADIVSLRFSLPYEPGSTDDQETLKELAEEYEGLHEVQILRHSVFRKDGYLQPRFREWVAYHGIDEANGRRAERLTTGPLRGSGGVAAQSIFFDQMTGAILCLINFGEGTCTEVPGVVHNGVIATIFDETLGRVAIRSTEKNTAVTANLKVDFQDPCKPGQWYCIFAVPDQAAKSTDTKKYVRATMWCTGEHDPGRPSLVQAYAAAGTVSGAIVSNNSVDEHTHAYGSALFVVPKNVDLKEIADEF